MMTGGTHSEFDVTLGARPGGVALKSPKSILYKHSHVAYQLKGIENSRENFFVTQLLLGQIEL